LFSLQQNQYVLQANDEDYEGNESSNIELYDMVADPRFFNNGLQKDRDLLPQKQPPNGGPLLTSRGSYYQDQPNLRQVVGLRNTLTCCVMQNQQYGKM
jgi:hypothetical protein